MSDDGWNIGNAEENLLKRKIEEGSTPIKQLDFNIYYGLKTGFNEAFYIDEETRERLIQSDPKCSEIIKPAIRGKDISKYDYYWKGIWMILIKCGWTNSIRKNVEPELFIENYYPSNI